MRIWYSVQARDFEDRTDEFWVLGAFVCSRLGRVRRTRFGSLVVGGRVPGSIDQYAQRVCIAAWLAFDVRSCARRAVYDRTQMVFVVERFGQSGYEHHALRRAGDQTMAERQKQKGLEGSARILDGGGHAFCMSAARILVVRGRAVELLFVPLSLSGGCGRHLPLAHAPDVVALGVDASNDGLGVDRSGHRLLRVQLERSAEQPALRAAAPRNDSSRICRATQRKAPRCRTGIGKRFGYRRASVAFFGLAAKESGNQLRGGKPGHRRWADLMLPLA